jgi:NADH-quinone oxidoreductase subunit A
MYFDYTNVLVFLAVGLMFVFINMIVGSLIRPKRKHKEGLETYECGEEAIGDTWIQFDIRYYTVALVYVIFAVEIAFLFPWAIVLNESMAGTGAAEGAGVGFFALVEGVAFILILFLGLAYVWAKGDLDWVLAYQGKPYEGRQPPPAVKVPTVAELETEDKASEDGETAEEAA